MKRLSEETVQTHQNDGQWETVDKDNVQLEKIVE